MRTLARALAISVYAVLVACGGDDRLSHPADSAARDAATAEDGARGQDAAVDALLDGGATTDVKRVIVFVWDGLRPDSVNELDTPNLFALATAGVTFADNHATYPTFTMTNAASFATGAFPGTTGFYGNTLYQPGPEGADSSGNDVDFSQPIFTEDYAILRELTRFYQDQLFLVGTLFTLAQRAGLKTAAIGKSGPAFLQDYAAKGLILDERTVFPLSLVSELQSAGFKVPRLTPNAYAKGAVMLTPDNGDPTAAAPRKNLADDATSDPTDTSGSPHNAANQYMLRAYLEYILPKKQPDLSLIWFRTPDSTEHTYGPGSPNHKDGLHAQDALLGQLYAKLVELGLSDTTDLLIVSDHGHSTVAGPAAIFPPRAIAAGQIGEPDPRNGYSVSGDVRIADLLTRAGFAAFDGSGCAYSPVLSGIRADGSFVYPTRTDDANGSACGAPGKNYTTPSYRLPATLPPKAIVIAANGGSDYLYVPDHDAPTIRSAVAFLQSREEIGAIFVAKRYGVITGTLPMDIIRVENLAGRHPDIIFSYAYDENAVVAGMKGTEFESMFNSRGMHGSFSPADVHNTLIAYGPHFAGHLVDTLPTGNVDLAPTIAMIFGLPLPDANGRPLLEALRGGRAVATDYTVADAVIGPAFDAIGLTMRLPTSPTGADIDHTKSSYTIELQTKELTHKGQTYTYFDYAKAVRR